MGRAIRAVTTEQGHDLSELTLFAFGGAGPLHSSEVARECGIRRLLVTQEPGTMCARGALLSDISLDFVRMQLSVATQDSWNSAREAFRGMLDEGDQWLSSEKVAKELRSFRLAIDAHYEGQNHELRVVLDDLDEGGLAVFLERFRQAHEAGYGYDIPGQAVVIVSCPGKAVGQIPKPPAPAYRGGDSVAAAVSSERQVYYREEGWLPSKVYRRGLLPVAAPVSGPAIITEMSATTVVLKGQLATIDPFGNIIIQA